jgi:hypothetical protein
MNVAMQYFNLDKRKGDTIIGVRFSSRNKKQGGPMMDIRALLMQMVGLQKTSIDNGFDALATIQDEAERITNDLMDQAGWVPSVSKGYMKEWFNMMKENRNDFKKAIDDGFAQMGGYVDTTLQRAFIS